MESKLDFRIIEMHVVEFSLKERLEQIIELKHMRFDISAEVKLNPPMGLIGVFVTIIISLNGTNDIIATFKCMLGFEIKDFSKNIPQNEKGEYQMPIDLEAAVKRISLSTSRGLLFSHLSPTYLKGLILPIVPELLTPPQKEKQTNDG